MVTPPSKDNGWKRGGDENKIAHCFVRITEFYLSEVKIICDRMSEWNSSYPSVHSPSVCDKRLRSTNRSWIYIYIYIYVYI